MMRSTAPLRIALRVRDPEWRETLARVLQDGGHSVAETAGAADVALADFAPDEGDRLPCVILSNSPLLARDADQQAVLPLSSDPRQIDAALRAVVAGLFVRACDPGPRAGFGQAEEPGALLTPREIEILAAIGDGLSNKEVARRLGISAHTVKFHLEAVFAKLDATTRAEAVAKGLRRGLIEA